jgi:hypothetical protein
VDLSGPEWFWYGGAQRIDPLVVVPVDVAAARSKVWRAATTRGLAKELRDPDVPIYMGPSPYMNLPGAADQEVDAHPYLLHATASGAEAVIHQGDELRIPFVEYLRCSLRRGGFIHVREHGVPDPCFAGSFADLGVSDELDAAFADIAAGFEPF